MCSVQLERKDDLEKQVIFLLTRAPDWMTLNYPEKSTNASEHHVRECWLKRKIKNPNKPQKHNPANTTTPKDRKGLLFFSFLFFKQKMQFCWTSIRNKNDCKVIFLKAKYVTVLKKNLEKEKAVSKWISTPRRVTKKHTWVFVRGRTDRHPTVTK